MMDNLLALYANIGYEAWRKQLDQAMIKPKHVAQIVLINDGWKRVGNNHPMPRADYYLDCRPIPNPFLEPKLATLTGDDGEVIAWVKLRSRKFIDSFIQIIEDGIHQIPTRRLGNTTPYAKPVIIATMCAHGIHRSRAMKHILAEELRQRGWASVTTNGPGAK